MFIIHCYLGQSGRRGKVTWTKIAEDPHKFIDPKFLLDLPFLDPTRINLTDIKVYWQDWVSRDTEGEPFAFLSTKGKEKMEKEESPLPGPSSDFNVDYGISLPCQCTTPVLRTSCLQQLVAQEGKGGKLFHELVNLVNTLEVSPTLAM
jgi:hypothetical protein